MIKKVLLMFLFLPFSLVADIPLTPTDAQIYHFLSRTTNGVTSKNFAYVKKVGIQRYLEEQLYIKPLTEFPSYEKKIHFITPKENPREYQKLKQKNLFEAKVRKLKRSIYTQAQLADVMNTFWYNHFNVFAQKGNIAFYLLSYEEEAILPNSLGSFRELLGAVAKHPAMLIYLDNQKSVKENVKKNRGLNENFARELMELHTLGVGKYKQNDIKELARILTGWGVNQEKGFVFHPKMHDQGTKEFLGHKFTSKGGMQEGERALDILAFSEDTAYFIAKKLCLYFVSDTPSEDLIKEVAKIFYTTKGDIKKTLLSIFNSDEFWKSENQQNKYKNPYQYVLSLLRVTEIEIVNYRPVIGTLQQMGMPLYGRLTPDGYPLDSSKWLSPSTMEAMLHFAVNLGQNRFKVCDGNCKIETSFLTFIEKTSKMQNILQKTPKRLHKALLLGSPQMMRY